MPDDFWARLANRDEAFFVLSIKYSDREARSRIVKATDGFADVPFIQRLIAKLTPEKALSLRDDPGVVDVEILENASADATFHKLLELYRVYLYQVSGRFNISALNFSQNVRYFDRNSDGRGDRTIAEALDVLGSRIVPSLVAVGDGASLGVGPWAKAKSVIPVVATDKSGVVMDNSSRPAPGDTTWPVVLYAHGEPTEGLVTSSDKACGDGSHLTADQMLHPEKAQIPKPGGSSYATFKATSSLCLIHQYSELLRVMMRARTPVGLAEVEPFVSYYVDSPVNKQCGALLYRWADVRLQYGAPKYRIEVGDKTRLDSFVSGNSIELRPNYSIPLVKAFLSKLPSFGATTGEVKQRSISEDAVFEMLKGFELTDLLDVAANRNSVHFDRWKHIAEGDNQPVVRPDLVDAIKSYCENQSLFLVLPDVEKPFFAKME